MGVSSFGVFCTYKLVCQKHPSMRRTGLPLDPDVELESAWNAEMNVPFCQTSMPSP
eukprot:m.35563 g.35563  ORF g.35563 m.35563 type:complete len:56 (+) comp12401_c0_seq6:1-168(+)